ncbi:hypothetical protein FXF53_07455 [Micromonospora sp. WP24]|uniref:hypothetical protein n=1 Tax=Micromonospora sp. WP24 TaxID=2604469 RepID=UPI0011D7B849|nr:hypothetical protein [Micromonospora sp. WP24]TYC03953.1 hypothetical protein FXF53_07455 [Micromonospora sp. WP24]
MAFRTWGRLLLTALGVSVMAGAGQLGLAYGLGIVRLTGAFTGATVNQWPAQLVWVGWFAANATVAGAVLTERLARRTPGPSTTGRVLAVGAAAALGAFTVAPLCMQPARTVEIGSVDPVLAVGICAILGAVVGAGAAIAVLLNPPLGWNVAATAGAVWLLALASTLPSLGATGSLRTVRLGVLEPAGLDVDAAQRLSLFLLPIVALLAGAATATLARWRGAPPLVSGATGVAGPVLVAFAYLTAGPGDTIDRYQGTPYYGALVSIGAGVLGSAAAALLRWPVGTRTIGAHALPPKGGPRRLPTGRTPSAGLTPPTPGTSDAPAAGPAEARLTVSSTLGGPAERNDPGEAPTATWSTVAEPTVAPPAATEPGVAVPVAAIAEPRPDGGTAAGGESPVVGPQRGGQELALDADRTLSAEPDAAAPPAAAAAAAAAAAGPAGATPAPATATDEPTPAAEATGSGEVVPSIGVEPAEQPVAATPTEAHRVNGPATEAQPVEAWAADEARAADSQPTDEPSAEAQAADEPSAAKSVAAAAKRPNRRPAGRSTEPQPVGQPAAEPASPAAEPASAGTESVETAGSAGRQANSESAETVRAPKPRRTRKARSTTSSAATDRGADSATQATEEGAAAATDQGGAAAAPEPSERIAARAKQDVAVQLSAPRAAADVTGAAGLAEVGRTAADVTGAAGLAEVGRTAAASAASGAAAVAGDAEAEATGRLRHDEPTTTPNPSDVDSEVVDGGPTTGGEPTTAGSALPGGGDLAPTPTAQLAEQPGTPATPIDGGPPAPRGDHSQGAAVPPISPRSPDSADAASDPAPATGPAAERQDPPSGWPLWPTRRRAPVDAVEPARPQLPEQTSDFAPRARHRAPLPDLNQAASWEGLAGAHSAGPVSTDVPEPAEAADPEPSGDDAPAATSTGDEAVERPRTPEQATGRTRGRLGLFRRTRPQPEPESAAEEPVPAQDEEYVDWVAGLSRPLHDNEPDQESGRRSLRSSGRHHRS